MNINSLQGASLSNIMIVGALIIYMIYVQVVERKFKAKKYIMLPIIAIWITASTVGKIKGNVYNLIPGITMLIIIGLVCGVIAGFIANIYKKEDGELYIKGGWQMLVFLIISLPTRMILSHFIISLPQDVGMDYGTAYLIRLTFMYIGRAVVIYMRVPEFWEIFKKQKEEKRARKRKRREV